MMVWPNTYVRVEMVVSPSASLAVEVAGVLAAAAPLGKWVCHRGRSDITLAGSHCRDPRATMSQAGLQARAGSPPATPRLKPRSERRQIEASAS